MKTLLKPAGLFTGRKLWCALFAGVVALTSCSTKNDNTPPVTEEDAAEVVIQSVDPGSIGLAAQVRSTALVSANASYLGACGMEKDSTLADQGMIGNNISWAYNFNWNWELTCSENVPSQFDLSFKGVVNYNGPRMQSSDSSRATFIVTNLSDDQLTVNATLERAGYKLSKIGRQLDFRAYVKLAATNLVVDKATQKILSGIATVEVSCVDRQNRTLEYIGDITFTGNNIAMLYFDNGYTKTLTW